MADNELEIHRRITHGDRIRVNDTSDGYILQAYQLEEGVSRKLENVDSAFACLQIKVDNTNYHLRWIPSEPEEEKDHKIFLLTLLHDLHSYNRENKQFPKLFNTRSEEGELISEKI